MVESLYFTLAKPLCEITTGKIQVNEFLQIGAPETALLGEMIIIDLDKGFKIFLDAEVIVALLYKGPYASFSETRR